MTTGVTLDFNANLTRFTSAIDKATNDLNKFQSNSARVSGNISKLFAGLGVGLSVAGFAGFIKSSIDAADKLKDLSKSTGISVEQLSGLQLAAKQSGTDLEGVAQSINKLSVNIGKDAEKFALLGITAKEPLEAFKQLADVFVAIKDPQERAAVAAEALGRSWASAAPLLSEGGKAIGETVEKGIKLAGVTEDMTDRADKFNEQLDELKTRAGHAGIAIADGLIPFLNSAVKEFQLGIKHAGGFGSALKALGTINPFQNTQENIRDYSEELAKLEKNRPAGTGKAFGSVIEQEISRTDARIKTLKTRIGFLKESAQEEALALGKGFENYKIPAIPTPAKDKPNTKAFLGGSSKASTGDRAKKPSIDIKNFFDVENTQFLAGLEAQKSIIETAHQSQLISDEAYWEARGKISNLALDAEKTKLEKSLAEQQDLIKRLGSSDKDKTFDANQKVLEIQSSILNIEQKRAVANFEIAAGILATNKELEDQAKTWIDLIDPVERYRKKLEEIDKLQSAGKLNADQASEARFLVNEEIDGLNKVTEKIATVDEFAKNAAKNMQDSFADFLFDPFKSGLDGMLQGFGQLVQRMIAEAVAADLAKRLFGDLSKGGSGDGIFGEGLKALGGLFAASAKGNVFNSAGLSAYSGQIVSKPTLFPFANGIGLMGEEPGSPGEAVMPLTRIGGDLGVKVSGMGGGSTINVYVSGSNNAPDVRRAAGQGAREALAALAGAQRYG